ncbi:Ig-like domain-containing protein [Paenibacillus sp. TRM 82003]|nr:Ig-like domain-containing protein [Paenibacillus sp. TRM 82003]MCI3923462.1 Ig-like domain-containing protein [Paenibacillus sp. TRM 82003]
MTSNGGDRPFLEWDTKLQLSGIDRMSKLSVYVKYGETVYFGSNVYESFDGKDIVVTRPHSGTQVLDVLSNGAGQINTRAKEAGPSPLYSGGYQPLEITASDPRDEGWWGVEFHGPVDSGNPEAMAVTSLPAGTGKGSNAAAWDVTVVGTDLLEKKGRLFTYSLALNMGDNLRSLQSKLYILTKDGFLYRTDMNGIDPYGFIFFSNNRGYIDGAKTLYRSVPIPLPTGVSVQNPMLPDTGTDVTHRVFFNEPSADLPPDVPTSPVLPSEPKQFRFLNEYESGPVSLIERGGSFRFSLERKGTYQIIIDTDKDGIFHPTTDTVIENVAAAGETVFAWDGKDKNGDFLSVGEYKAKIMIKGGEYHFPLLDVESAQNGFTIEMLNVPDNLFPVGITKTMVYYNDRNYRTSSGSAVSLDGTNGAFPRSAVAGIDSVGGAHGFGSGAGGSDYGNNKAMDTWTYFPGPTDEITLTIVDNSVSGVVFEDRNQDGDKDSGENGIAGIEVTIADSDGNSATVTTDANGSYFLPTVHGNVTVSITPSENAELAGLSSTTGATTRTVNVPLNERIVAAGFGFAYQVVLDKPLVRGILDDGGAQDGRTQDQTLVLYGTAEPHTTVEVFLNGSSIGTTVADASGDWTVDHTATTLPANARYDAYAKATDTWGNVSPNSDIFIINVDTELDIEIEYPGNNAKLNDPTPTVSGTSEPGANVELHVGSELLKDTIMVDSTGRWSYTLTEVQALSDGIYMFRARAVDGARNEAEDTLSLTIDTVTRIDIEIPVDGGVLSDATPVVSGTSEPGATVTISVYGATIATGLVVEGNGTWSYTLTEEETLPDGIIPITATVVDSAGNSAADTAIINVDASVRVEILLPQNNAMLREPMPTLSGTAEIGSTVTLSVYDSAGHVRFAVPVAVAGDGSWRHEPTFDQTLTDDRYTITANVVDAVGNRSQHSIAIAIDTVTTVKIESPANGAALKEGTPTVTGTAEPGASVIIAVYGTGDPMTLGTVMADGNGRWSYTVTGEKGLKEGPHRLTAIATDVAGNSASDQVLIDVGGWTEATILLVATPSVIVGDGVSQAMLSATVTQSDGRPIPGVTVTFSAEAGTLSAPSAVTDANGQARIQLTSPALGSISEVRKNVSASVHDEARRLNGIDEISILFEPASIHGTVVNMQTGLPLANATVTVSEDFDKDGTIDFNYSVKTDVNGKYSFPVPQGNYRYTARIVAPMIVNGQSVSLSFTQETDVGTIQGIGETFESTRKAVGQFLAIDEKTGAAKPIMDVIPNLGGAAAGVKLKTTLLNDDSGTVQLSIQPNGSFEAVGIEKNKTYEVAMQIVAANGNVLVGHKLQIKVDDDGVAAVQVGLVDPYGIIRDENGTPIPGVDVRLYWADTNNNRLLGRVPHELVPLPLLPGFAPNDNANPQTSDNLGAYAWMVFPNGDYYIVARKSGFETYDSRVEGRNVPMKAGEDSYVTDGIIHVGNSIVEYDFSMKSIPTPTGTETETTPTSTPSSTAVEEKGETSLPIEHYAYILGYEEDGEFKPARALSRAELAAIIARLMMPNPPTTVTIPPYEDAREHWASTYIEIVRRLGLMKGYEHGGFEPDRPVTRAEIAVVIARMRDLKAEENFSFLDASGHWAADSIQAVFESGLMIGDPKGRFRPNDPLTRAEAVTLMNRMLDRGPLEGLNVSSWPDVSVEHWAFRQIEEASRSHKSIVDDEGREWFEEYLNISTW